ncbi:uncharacterized protein LOC131196062 isoform X2 [Ahaetulla prasina]|uniref:uncharacterized protein LOC131196062 isoform X2 n=1 Tax=Ahaetulla prasina TaxID=499056 RepID=UPI0026486684|nr:uncharacterized protein LOC131196062 isoform X2 [Ahaetulla prasina]
MACGAFLSGLFFIVFSSLSSASNGGVKAKDPWLSQPQRSVSVIIGEVLHLECKVPDDPTPGGVKWYLGEGPQRKLIYADVEIDGKDERVTRNSPGSSTDFTISIRNVTLEDAGTYYCVKEKKGSGETTLKGPVIQVIVEASRRNNSIIPIVAGVSGFILVCLFCVALYLCLKMKKGLTFQKNNNLLSRLLGIKRLSTLTLKTQANYRSLGKSIQKSARNMLPLREHQVGPPT